MSDQTLNQARKLLSQHNAGREVIIREGDGAKFIQQEVAEEVINDILRCENHLKNANYHEMSETPSQTVNKKGLEAAADDLYHSLKAQRSLLMPNKNNRNAKDHIFCAARDCINAYLKALPASEISGNKSLVDTVELKRMIACQQEYDALEVEKDELEDDLKIANEKIEILETAIEQATIKQQATGDISLHFNEEGAEVAYASCPLTNVTRSCVNAIINAYLRYLERYSTIAMKNEPVLTEDEMRGAIAYFGETQKRALPAGIKAIFASLKREASEIRFIEDDVERVARAIVSANHLGEDDLVMCDNTGAFTENKPRWQWYIPEAKAAIAAMSPMRESGVLELNIPKELLKAVFNSRHWAEEGQAWGFLLDESLYGRIEDYLNSIEGGS